MEVDGDENGDGEVQNEEEDEAMRELQRELDPAIERKGKRIRNDITDTVRLFMCDAKSENGKLTHQAIAQMVKTKFKVAISESAVGKTLKLSDEIRKRLAGKDAHTKGLKKRSRCGKYADLEKALYAWFISYRRGNNGFAVTDMLLKEKALQLAGSIGLPDLKASADWLTGSKKRHGIHRYRMQVVCVVFV